MPRMTLAACALALLAACSRDTPPADTTETNTTAATETVTLPLPLPSDTTAAITAEDMAKRIKTLSDDAFEGRGPGAPVGELTADWLAQEFARIGVQPGGENGTYFQTVGMVEQSLDEAKSSLSFAGGRSGDNYTMTLKEDAVLWTKRQSVNALEWADSEIVFVGYGVVAPEFGWDDYAGLDA